MGLILTKEAVGISIRTENNLKKEDIFYLSFGCSMLQQYSTAAVATCKSPEASNYGWVLRLKLDPT